MLFSVSKTGEIFQNLDHTANLRLPYGNLNTWRSQLVRHSKSHKSIVSQYRKPEFLLEYDDILVLGIACLSLQCANSNCQSNGGSIGEATHGAHIVHRDKRRSGLYIAPLCKSCNMLDQDLSIYVGCPLLCVTSKSRNQNSKKSKFAVAHVHLLHDVVKILVPTSP